MHQLWKVIDMRLAGRWVMRRWWAILAAGLVVGVIVLVAASWPLHDDHDAAARTSPSPTPPPQWVIDAARHMAANNGHVTGGCWGLLHDPELGDLTSSGPDDPSTKAYAIVLVGAFPAALARIRPIDTSVSSSPLPVPHFVMRIFDATTHGDAGIWGCGPSFDASRYPSLKPFSLE